jgi:membrane protein DedA with SNARE-associated domain
VEKFERAGNMQTVIRCVTRYGYPGIFSMVALAIFGLPISEEMLLTFVGYVVFPGPLDKISEFVSTSSSGRYEQQSQSCPI